MMSCIENLRLKYHILCQHMLEKAGEAHQQRLTASIFDVATPHHYHGKGNSQHYSAIDSAVGMIYSEEIMGLGMRPPNGGELSEDENGSKKTELTPQQAHRPFALL